MALSTTIHGDGDPIVVLPWFSHDGAAMAQAFEPVFTDSAPWQRIYLDLPGTGASPPVEPTSDAVLDAVGETIAGLLGDRRYLLAGCSYGGHLAAAQARRDAPQVAGLLLVCSGPKLDPAMRNLSGVIESTPEPDWLDGVPTELHGYFEHAVGHQTREVADRVAAVFATAAPTDEDYLTTLRSTAFPLSAQDAPDSVDSPTLMLVGRTDRVAGYVDQFEDLARYPRGSYVALDAAGHYLPFEQPQRFATLVRDWLARQSVAGTAPDQASRIRASTPS
jgi:pimeloyl-ACP methyl ester carboxylesterase